MEKAKDATKIAMGRFGAYVRSAAKNSIKKRDGSAQPGRPPHSHTGILKRFIFFSYDELNRSVVIGPEKLSGKNQGEAQFVLEYGGSVTASVRGRNGGRYQKRYNISARPYMNPAFEASKEKIPEVWKDCIK